VAGGLTGFSGLAPCLRTAFRGRGLLGHSPVLTNEFLIRRTLTAPVHHGCSRRHLDRRGLHRYICVMKPVKAVLLTLVLMCPASALGAAVRIPRILLLRVGDQTPQVVYKPRTFSPSSHYQVRNARWTQWNLSVAIAHVRLGSEFPGQAPEQWSKTTITYSDFKRVCGVFTYTHFTSDSGAAAKLVVERYSGSPKYCLFVIQ
jgi:hypothetical protein